MRLTEIAHTEVAAVLKPGHLAIDTTAGNGHDTVKLAIQVGPEGRVWAFDVQDSAIASTRTRLDRFGVANQVTLITDSHANLINHIPSEHHGDIRVVMANLGYLPGSGSGIITGAESTLVMLTSALKLLHPAGIISLLVYPGHVGGDIESDAVLDWIKRHDELSVTYHGEPRSTNRSPWLALIKPERNGL